MPEKYVCVFCASSTGNHPEYVASARELGKTLAAQGYGLVYGGGTMGLMGSVAKAVNENGGHVVGISPRPLLPLENRGETIGELLVVEDMSARKRLMNEKSDAFVILPGGYGTMDELLEMVTWSQINIHSKPIALFNIRGYFDSILQWIDHAAREGFISDGNKDIPVAGNTVDEVLHLLQTYQAPATRFIELEWTREENN